jgi:hypothetical protein
MMDQVADRLQFELQQLRDRVAILEALVLPKAETSAPESGPLPEIAPVLHPAPETSGKESLPLPAPTPEHQELNILSGMGMTTGARR